MSSGETQSIYLTGLQSCLQQLARDGMYLRLSPHQPAFARHLAGKVMHARRVLSMTHHACNLVRLRDEDLAAADNEMAMAKTGTVGVAERAAHLQRNNVLRAQARRREERAANYLFTANCAEVLG